ncbi:hypothetical protein BFP70_11065 [Thioclava sp. SK-1]|uniref:COG3904 family protein n=1 Tax=Thioclava sp. SK-1 TaxID=1889770 RepID=UPI000826B795|nr:hypothetical protein [Thioclava sp. SK-1]OCX64565.1 hypothetical protein BFP70_11065 [Thioclava sp. SK-1]
MTPDLPRPNPIGRAIKALIVVQIAIGATLIVLDLSDSFSGASPLTAPGPSGPETRPYSPNERPSGVPGLTPRSQPMPERLEFTGTGTELTLTGQIAPGDAARITDELTLRAETGQPVTQIALDSTGGSVQDALDIGRIVRDSGIGTRVDSGAICLSACPYLFAGGITRSVATDGKIGVHQHYFGKNAILPAFMAVEDVQRGQANVMGYLLEMGIDPAVMEPAMRTAPNRIYLLTPEELRRFALTTTPAS